MACSTDAASPSTVQALLVRWAVVLHGLDRRLMSEPRILAAAGHCKDDDGTVKIKEINPFNR